MNSGFFFIYNRSDQHRRAKDILRAIIYSVLLGLIILTAYLKFKEPNTQPDNYEVAQNNKSAEPSLPPPSKQEDLSSVRTDDDKEVLTTSQITIPIQIENIKTSANDDETKSTALQKFNEGDYENAARLFAEISGKDKSALVFAGICYFKLGDYKTSIVFLEKAVEYKNNDFLTRKFLAFAYYKTDDLERSFKNAETALSLNKDPELEKFYAKLTREKNTQQDYIEESSEHFKIFFDGYNHGSINRDIISILEDAYRYIGRELDYFPSGMVTVILYTNNDFHDTTQAPEWSGGVYDGKIKIPIRGAEGQGALLKKVLFHEYTHAVVYSFTNRCPLWMNEGLAEFFSSNYPKKIGQAIPLNYLESSFSAVRSKDIGIAYWESYSAVSYLIEKYGVYRMKTFLLSLSQNADRDQAFKEAFDGTYDSFISEWGKN